MSTVERAGVRGAPRPAPVPDAVVVDPAHLRRRLWGIVGGYALVATLWILFSDQAVNLVADDADDVVWFSTAKGLVFVAVTAVLLLGLIRRAFAQIGDAYTVLERSDLELARLDRLHRALVRVNQAIVRRPERDELFREVCRALVDDGGFGVAAIELDDDEATVEVRREDIGDRPGDPGLCFPLHRGGVRCGVLRVDSGSWTLDDAEHALLVEAAADLSYALDDAQREEERATAETRARQERVFSATMIDSMPGVVYFYDRTGRFLRWNRNFEVVSGYGSDEIAGMHPLDFFEPGSHALLAERIDQVFEEGEASVEAPFRCRNGDTIPYFFTGRRVAFDGRTCLVGVGIDITQRKEAEDALRDLNETLELKVAARTEELNAALVRAEAADRIKSAFLATMSHELRTPLNSIIGFTGIILQGLAGPLNPEQEKQLGMVRASAQHLLALINDVLDISKIEAGQLEVWVEPFDLDAVVDRVTGTVRPLVDDKGLALETSVPPGLGTMVSDERRVEQILLNLLSNAVKFTDTGTVTLAVEPVDHCFDGDARTVPAVRLRVRDTGIGIAPDDLQVLFQPFRQIDSGLTRRHEGTGLGLAICRRLADLLGGTITATSDVGRGSEFTVVLPRDARDAAGSRAADDTMLDRGSR